MTTMNKFTKKIAGKFGIFAPIALAILIAGIVVAAIFGFNTAPAYSDVKTLTVKVNSYYTEERVSAVKDVCKAEFSKAGVSSLFDETDVSTSLNNYEIVYCFKADEKADFAELKKNVEEKLTAAAEASGENKTALEGLQTLLRVTVNEKTAMRTATRHFALRAAIAGGVLLLAVFVYVSLRHKLAAGLAAAAIALVTLGLTVALTAICRIPFSAMSVNAWFISLLFGALFGTIAAGRMHAAEKDEENAGLDAKEITVKGASEKTLFALSAGIALGTLLIGAMGFTPAQWFSLLVIAGLASALFTAGILYPAMYSSILKKLLVSRAERSRYDYVKKSRSEKKKNAAQATESAAAENGEGENEAK